MRKMADQGRSLKLDVQALRSYLSLIYEYELYILPNKKASTAKGHGKNYLKDGSPLVRHLLRDCLFVVLSSRSTHLGLLSYGPYKLIDQNSTFSLIMF